MKESLEENVVTIRIEYDEEFEKILKQVPSIEIEMVLESCPPKFRLIDKESKGLKPIKGEDLFRLGALYDSQFPYEYLD